MKLKHVLVLRSFNNMKSILVFHHWLKKNKCNTFQQLIERDNKLSERKEKLLSHAGKEILIKTGAQEVSTYTMSVFKLPNALCDEMTSMVQNF